MELCQFSLQTQPEPFRQLLHAGEGQVGALVLDALVQDLVRGVAFLHSKRVFHCDIKPANVLVAFGRSGKKRSEFKPKYFKDAQLKLADFGVSRVLKQAGAGAGAAAATTTTASVSLEGLQAAQGVAGTESYMCPELLQLLRDLKQGKLQTEPEIGAATGGQRRVWLRLRGCVPFFAAAAGTRSRTRGWVSAACPTTFWRTGARTCASSASRTAATWSWWTS